MGPNNTKWGKCKDEMIVEKRDSVRMKYEELDAEKGTVEGEWRQYNDVFVGVRYTDNQKPRMVDGRGGEGSGGGGEAGSTWKVI